MSDAEAARWGEPEAVEMRKTADRGIGLFEWARIARCGGSPPVWEIGVRPVQAKKLWVFRIGGSRATELRMLSVTGKTTRSCVPVNINGNLESVGAELPW